MSKPAMSKPRTARSRAARRSLPDQGLLDASDAWLMVYVTEACQRVHCFDLVQEARELPRSARRAISEIVSDINCPEDNITDEPWLHASAELQAKLSEAVLAAGLGQDFADAFIMSGEEWERRHVRPLRSASEEAASVVCNVARLRPARRSNEDAVGLMSNAIGLITEAMDIVCESTTKDAGTRTEDLERARGSLIRAMVATPQLREAEYQQALADLTESESLRTVYRALQQHVIELAQQGANPGSFYLDIDRIGRLGRSAARAAR